jgi:hypothetical protein
MSRTGVTRHVVQRFLDHAVHDALNLRVQSQSLHLAAADERAVERDRLIAHRPDAADKALDGGSQPVRVECGWAELRDKAAKVDSRRIDLLGRLFEQLGSRLLGGRALRHAKQQFDRRQVLQRLVVQLACPVSAFAFACNACSCADRAVAIATAALVPNASAMARSWAENPEPRSARSTHSSTPTRFVRRTSGTIIAVDPFRYWATGANRPFRSAIADPLERSTSRSSELTGSVEPSSDRSIIPATASTTSPSTPDSASTALRAPVSALPRLTISSIMWSRSGCPARLRAKSLLAVYASRSRARSAARASAVCVRKCRLAVWAVIRAISPTIVLSSAVKSPPSALSVTQKDPHTAPPTHKPTPTNDVITG